MAQQQTVYDVAIVGSGAGGGMAAYALTKAGAKVVMLEAGGEWYASKNSAMMVPAYASPRRGASTKTRPFGEFDACDGGCSVKANFSSPDVLIAPALKTGNLKLITNAMAREVTIGKDGLATGVTYVDKATMSDRHVRARIVVLAASALESARLLLNSKT